MSTTNVVWAFNSVGVEIQSGLKSIGMDIEIVWIKLRGVCRDYVSLLEYLLF